jgi:very-short-patch-repair endonuclease
MCSNQKRRDYCFQLSKYTEEEYKSLLMMDCKYIILGKEIDEEKNEIVKGYIYFYCPKTFQSVKKLAPNAEIIELLKTPKMNYDFCSKQKRFDEKGELPNNRGQKKDNNMLGKVIFRPKTKEQSFAIHEKAKHWSKLNNLKPEEVFLNSHKSYWFDCPECNHSYESILNNINCNNSGCPYCYNRKVCGKKECTICFEKSFASHEKSQFWSKKNGVLPINIINGTSEKYLFDCPDCKHEISISLKGIKDDNKWCSYCSHQKLCEDKKCSFCLKNSFASSEYSIYWNNEMNIQVTPRQVFKFTNKKFWFDCVVCNNSFEKIISDVTCKNTWCPICKKKTEMKIFDVLKEKYNDVKRDFRVSWCKNIHFLPFDFVLLNKKIIIELDGPHHFEQISNWSCYEKNQERDLYKMKCANKNGYSVIRLLQKDVFYDKYDWLSCLQENINKIEMNGKIQNIYICKNNEYKDFVTEI